MTKSDPDTALYTPRDIAKWCSCDQKSVHNWVNKGLLAGHRTPGRHLRFTRTQCLDFLKTYSYPIPKELREP